MEKRHTLSAAIITYNEEKNIQACLDSIHDIVDEIIVMDSFSTDATEAICRKNPKVKFYQHPFDGHMQQKSRAMDRCASEWVLSLDADERVTPELRRSIEEFLMQDTDVAGVKFARLPFHMNRYIRHGGWYPNKRYRMVRKAKARWGGENPHDKLVIHGKGTQIAGDLLHYTAKDLSDQVHTINKYSSIVALVRYNKGKRFHLWRLLLKPVSKFMEMYVVKFGFLDGMQGFIIAVSSSYASFLREAKLFELRVLGSEKPSNLSDLYVKNPDSKK